MGKPELGLPLLHEPRVKLWWPALDDVVEIAQDSSEPYDAPTTLWPAGAVLAHALASDCASWQGKVIIELGSGVGAAALALARCNATVVATDISEAALALTAENTNGTNGTVVTRLLDWDDDDALREVLAEGPFFAVVGAALKFEAWPADRLDAVLIFPSMPEVMRLNKVGGFTMASLGQSKSVVSEFMKKKKADDGSSFEEAMLKLLRTLPKVLKYLPGTVPVSHHHTRRWRRRRRGARRGRVTRVDAAAAHTRTRETTQTRHSRNNAQATRPRTRRPS